MPDMKVYPSWAPNDPDQIKLVRDEKELQRAMEMGYLPVEGEAGKTAPPAPAAPPTRTEGAARGARQGATLGFADEVAGLGALLGDLSVDGVAPEFRDDPGDVYRQGRNEDRAETARVKAARPNAFLAGEVAGAVAVPLGSTATLGRAAAKGAAMGAAAGAGNADELEHVPAALIAGGLVGGAGGAVGQKAGQALQKGAARMAQAAQTKLPDAMAKADEMRALTFMGATGGSINKKAILEEAERVPGGVSTIARVMRETEGTAPVLGRTRPIGNAAERAAIQSRDEIQGVLGKVDAAGERVDVKQFSQALRMEALDLATTRPEMQVAARELLKKADDYDALYPNGATMAEAQVLKTDLGNAVNWVAKMTGARIPGGQQAAATATRAMTREMDEATRRALGDDAVKGYRAAREKNQVMRMGADLAKDSVEKAEGNRSFGLMTGVAGGLGATIGAVAGGPGGAGLGSMAGMAAQKLGSAYGATARASTAEAAARMVRALADPRLAARMGDAGARLTAAAARGEQELAAAYLAEKLSNPDVMKLEEILAMVPDEPVDDEAPSLRAMKALR